jgi:hypothetical protein
MMYNNMEGGNIQKEMLFMLGKETSLLLVMMGMK